MLKLTSYNITVYFLYNNEIRNKQIYLFKNWSLIWPWNFLFLLLLLLPSLPSNQFSIVYFIYLFHIKYPGENWRLHRQIGFGHVSALYLRLKQYEWRYTQDKSKNVFGFGYVRAVNYILKQPDISKKWHRNLIWKD